MAESREAEPHGVGAFESSVPARLRPGARVALARATGFIRDIRGATAIEYAMIGALIFAVAAGSIRLYGTKVNTVYGQIGSAMAQIN